MILSLQEALFYTSETVMRFVEISFAEISYVHSIAYAFITKQITIQTLYVLSNIEIIARLSNIKGVKK